MYERGVSVQLVLLTALGVGGATIFGALIGFAFKDLSHKFSDIVLSFAAGVMLAAAILGLIMPSVEYGNLVITIAGIFVGAFSLNLIDRLVPHMHKLVGVDTETHPGAANVSKVLLFVTAIAIHNLPEGIAAGVGFGTGNNAHAFSIAIASAVVWNVTTNFNSFFLILFDHNFETSVFLCACSFFAFCFSKFFYIHLLMWFTNENFNWFCCTF